MQVLHASCCGLDIHKRFVVACLLTTRADGGVEKEVRTFGTMTHDLLALADPHGLAGRGAVFTFPFITTEAVWVEDERTLVLVNDNNYPGSSGREFGVSDNNEFVVLHVAPLLDCDDEGGRGRHGKVGGRKHHDKNECELARD